MWVCHVHSVPLNLRLLISCAWNYYHQALKDASSTVHVHVRVGWLSYARGKGERIGLGVSETPFQKELAAK